MGREEKGYYEGGRKESRALLNGGVAVMVFQRRGDNPFHVSIGWLATYLETFTQHPIGGSGSGGRSSSHLHHDDMTIG